MRPILPTEREVRRFKRIGIGSSALVSPDRLTVENDNDRLPFGTSRQRSKVSFHSTERRSNLPQSRRI